MDFDVFVIGAGPAGYPCAIRASQLGLKAACVDARETLGGTCLNVGCIPSKALLFASEKYSEAQHNLADLGVGTGKITLDLAKMMAHKDGVVADNTKGIDFLFKKNKVKRYMGFAKITAPNTVEVTGKDGSVETVTAKHIVIATGSDVASLPNIIIDENRVVSSTGALKLPSVPKSLIVIGGGYIGLEMGAVWQRLGATVTVVEYLDRILPAMDTEISSTMQKILTKQGIQFKLSTKVTSVTPSDSGVTVVVEPASGGTPETLKADYVLVAVGRKAYTGGLGLEIVGVKTDDRGRVITDSHFQTNVAGIYAVGDVIAGPMLAHKAEEEGEILAEILVGQKPHIDYRLIPGVVYTAPEAATVGDTEEVLKAAGIPYKVGKFPYSANGRARAMNQTEGFVKLLVHKDTDEVLGAHIIGHEAGTLIAEIALAMEFKATAEDIYRTSHAHPTLSEIIKEAAMASAGRAIHM